MKNVKSICDTCFDLGKFEENVLDKTTKLLFHVLENLIEHESIESTNNKHY